MATPRSFTNQGKLRVIVVILFRIIVSQNKERVGSFSELLWLKDVGGRVEEMRFPEASTVTQAPQPRGVAYDQILISRPRHRARRPQKGEYPHFCN